MIHDITSHINYRGREIGLVFNLNVMEDLQTKYGTIEAWQEKCYGGDKEIDIAALKYGFMLMMNEQLDIENEEQGKNDEPFTLRQVGRILTEIGLQNVAEVIGDAIVKSTESTEKNG